MKSFAQTVSSAVADLGEPVSLDLGSDVEREKAPPPGGLEKWRQIFIDRLVREGELHKQALLRLQLAFFGLAAFGMLVVAVGMLLLIRVRDDGSALRIVFGGGSLAGMAGVLAVVRGTLGKIRQIAADKAAFDILLTVIPVLEPAEVVKAVQSIHYGSQERGK